jgi:hypothetical protein
MRGLDAMPNAYTKYKYIPRICYACGRTKTTKTKKGFENWFLNLPTELVLCDRCYCRYFKIIRKTKGKWHWGKYGYDLTGDQRKEAYHKRWLPITNKCIIQFKSRSIFLGWNPRKGMCAKCNNKRRTSMHHLAYYIIFPWFATIELCMSCHTSEEWRLGRFAKRWEKRRTRSFGIRPGISPFLSLSRP